MNTKLKSVPFLCLWLPSLALAQAKPAVRTPSAVCTVTIKKITVRSEMGVGDVKINPATGEPELKYEFITLTSFNDQLPTTVALKVDYVAENCREPLVARAVLTPILGTRDVNFDDINVTPKQIKAARAAARPADRAWGQTDAVVAKRNGAGTVTINDVKVRKFYDALPGDQWAWTARFDVSFLEDGRAKATKAVSLDSDLEM